MKVEYIVFTTCMILLALGLFIGNPTITGYVVTSTSSFTITNVAPELFFIPNITAYEGDLIIILPNATDINGDTLVYNFSTPFNQSGYWQTDYNDAGNYTVNVSVNDGQGGSDWQIIGVNILRNSLPAPENITITVLNHNGMVMLDWSDVVTAEDYIIFYSTNVTALENFNVSSGNDQVFNFTSTPSAFIDTASYLNRTRFYRVASHLGLLVNISKKIYGKYTYLLHGLSADPNPNKKKNWVSLMFDTNDSAEDLLQVIPNSAGAIMEKLIRTSNTSYTYFPHIKGLGANNFALRELEGYNVEVIQDVNYTQAGEYNLTLNKSYILYGLLNDPTNNPNNKKNWIGIVDDKGEVAEDLIQNVSSGSIIEKLYRANNESYQYVPHIRGLGANNFDIEICAGYNVEVAANVVYAR